MRGGGGRVLGGEPRACPYGGDFIFVWCYRCEYDSTCSLLVSLFDQTASDYQKLLQGLKDSQELPLREGT